MMLRGSNAPSGSEIANAPAGTVRTVAAFTPIGTRNISISPSATQSPAAARGSTASSCWSNAPWRRSISLRYAIHGVPLKEKVDARMSSRTCENAGASDGSSTRSTWIRIPIRRFSV